RGFSGITKRSMKIPRADEYPVQSVHCSDLSEVIQCSLGLDLNQYAEFLVRTPGIIFHPPKAGGSCGSTHTAETLQRITCVRVCVHRFLFVLYVGNEQCLSADIKETLNRDHVIPWYAYNGMRWVWRDSLQLRQHHIELVRRMFGIYQKPVEARARDHFNR